MRNGNIAGTLNFTWREAGDRTGQAMPPAVEANVIYLAGQLEELRLRLGKPIIINSWYRSPEHPIESGKKNPGIHTTGLAVDIAVAGEDAYALIAAAFTLGFSGIGINQRGDWSKRFVHLDFGNRANRWPRPRVWSY